MSLENLIDVSFLLNLFIFVVLFSPCVVWAVIVYQGLRGKL